MTQTKTRAAGALLALVASIWAVFRVAPAPLPDLPKFVAALGNWREANPDPAYDHLRENLLFQWLFEPAGSLGVNVYLLQWLVGVVLVVGGLAWIYRRNVSDEWKGMALRLAILSPVAAIMVGFFGSYDPVTMGLALLLLAAWMAQSMWATAIVGIFLGLQHFGQAVPMILALGLTSLALKPAEPRKSAVLLLAGIVGALAGKAIALLTLLLAAGDASGNRLPDSSGIEVLQQALTTAVNYFPVLLLSLFAGAWMIVFLAFFKRAPRGRVLLLAAFLLVAAFSFAITDHTRIFILLAFPSLALLTIRVMKELENEPLQMRVLEAMAWIITPIVLWTDSDGVGRVQYLGAFDAQIMAWQQVFGWG